MIQLFIYTQKKARNESSVWKNHLTANCKNHFLDICIIFYNDLHFLLPSIFISVQYLFLLYFVSIFNHHSPTHTVGKRKSMKLLYFSTSLIKTFSIFPQVQSKKKKIYKLNTNPVSLYFSHKTSPLLHKLCELSLE